MLTFSPLAAAHAAHALQSQPRSSSSLPVDVKMWTMRFKDLEIQKQIGEGSFGRVRRGAAGQGGAGELLYTCVP
jgi:hypothetical protein